MTVPTGAFVARRNGKVFITGNSGFPKSLDVSKAIDAHLGAEREIKRDWAFASGGVTPTAQNAQCMACGKWRFAVDRCLCQRDSGPSTPEAAQWDGWGTALKPAAEHWILARKPLDGTYAENLLKWGVGAINVGGCRIGNDGGGGNCPGGALAECATNKVLGATKHPPRKQEPGSVGRWPANVVLSHDARCVAVGTAVEDVEVYENAGERTRDVEQYRMGAQVTAGSVAVERDVYACVPGCPVRLLDTQAGGPRKAVKVKAGPRTSRPGGMMNIGADKGDPRPNGPQYGDAGGVSRFFYCAKPARSEKDAGLDHLPARTGGDATGREDGSAGLNSPRAGGGRGGGARNFHPTPKGVELMRYFIRLVTPPGGTVLDPFFGSGTTGVAAIAEGMSIVGAERDRGDGDEPLGYAAICTGRVEHALREAGLLGERRAVLERPTGVHESIPGPGA